ncbi:MAG: PAS domain-containing protein [Treponema sp.]|jgi:two-component system phosphate regulon sensor histidine kinase PhoR|nr:PAS domain-containing protein [Treponema sp.]
MNRIIFIATGLLSGLSIILTAVLIHFAVYWGFSRQMKHEVALELEYVRAGIEAAGEELLETLTPGPRLTLIAADGTVLFDNETDARNMENHSDREEVQSAAAGGLGESIHFSGTLGKRSYYRAVKLANGKILRIAVGMDSILSSAMTLAPLTLAIVVAVFVCSLFTASAVTMRIVKPLNSLDLEKPETNIVYEEFSPLLSRIREQKDQIEKQIRELKKKQIEFQAITDNMREGLLVLDREGHILSCNNSAIKLLRLSSAMENRNILELRRDQPFRLALEKTLNGIPLETLLSVEDSHLRLMANPVTDGGNVQGAVLLLLDVTEQEDREKLRREFSANVSHELKTPLTVISGYAEIFSSGISKPEEAAAFGAKIYREAQRLLGLINDIMLLSRLDEGGMELEREETDLLSLASGAVERIHPAAQARNIRIALEGENIAVSVIPQVLQEVLFNLLDNAVKYNRENGEVRITVTKNKNEIRLSVADTGIGIPPAEQGRVFERFYRLDKSRNGKTGGTGLGLSIVKHGAKLHGAGIEVESDGISGTKISLVFGKKDSLEYYEN